MRPAPNDQSSLNSRVRHVDVTDAESALWELLEPCRFGDRQFHRRVALGPYVVDFACVEARLVVEIDRGLHGEARSYESARTRFLERQGFSVLRFWSNDVVIRGEAVRDTIRARLLQ